MRWNYGDIRKRLGVDDWDANRRLIVLSAITLFVLIVWAGFAQVDDITRGMGKVVPSNKVQLVQAAAPSTVSAILVRQGELVKKGQLLVRLDDSQSASQLGQLKTENERLAVRAARLEQEGTGVSDKCDEGSLCAEEARLAKVRQEAMTSKEDALTAAVEQRRRDLQQGQVTVASLEHSVALSQRQVNMLEPLAAKGIVPKTDLLTAQRNLVDAQGRLGAAREGVARAKAAIEEAKAQLAAARYDFRQQALNESSEIATKIAVNEQTMKGAAARLKRSELRAPVRGFVNNMEVSTVGGFVNQGEKLMEIVPQGDKLLVEARVSPKDIAFIKVGDRANVKVTAYDFETYGGLVGQVKNISPDSIYDQNERKAYYRVMVQTSRSFLLKNNMRLPIMPGMICSVEIITGRKSILHYLTTPVLMAFHNAMTER